MLDCLQLLHFHIGSQISSIIPIKNAMQEASNIYVELAKMGCRMGYLDVGGGLAIDYDGSKTDFHASKNYTLQEYASDVVGHIQSACAKAEVPVPTIVSESGRAIAAHHSVLVFEVVGEERGALRRARGAETGRAPAAPRALRDVPRRRAEERAGELPRRQPGEGRGAEPVQVRLRDTARARPGGAAVLARVREDPGHAAGA